MKNQSLKNSTTLAAALALFAALTMAPTASAQNYGPWSTPVNLDKDNLDKCSQLGMTQCPIVNSACDDQHPTQSMDGLSLIFSTKRPQDPTRTSCDVALHLWVSQRDSLDSPWQTPTALKLLNGDPLNSPDSSPNEDHAPNLTTDGHWLFFHSGRTDGSCHGGGPLGQELWAAHRQDKRNDSGWETPINLGCTLNISGAVDAGPNFWEDDTTGTLYLYFTRNLTPLNSNGFDIYLSTCSADLDSCNRQQLWSPGVYVPELSSPLRDTRTAIRRRDGLEMIVTSNRAGTVGLLDMWDSTRDSVQDNWSIPVNLNQDNLDKCSQLRPAPASCPVVNTTANDGAPALSWDGQTMIFYSNFPGLPSSRNHLYMSTRQIN